nr:PDZ domain-containing protein [Neisseria sp. HSC-16F19]
MLHYHIRAHSLQQHLWHVRLSFHQEHPAETSFSLPNWVPGSYMIREFARHIVQIEAGCDGQAAVLQQCDKNTWRTDGRAGHWQIDCLIYGFDLSVRGSWLTEERGFFDGACVFLRHNQRQDEACRVRIDVPEHWDLVTSLPPAEDGDGFQAANYRDLIDHPCEMGVLTRLPFEAGGIQHEIILSGFHTHFDAGQLQSDIQRICAAQLAFFPRPAPFKRYLFLLHVGDQIYGGLEHKSSTALLADRHSLPRPNTPAHDDYIALLGLFSHEYFHSWNVKSIIPQAFAESDLNSEAYSEQLWAFEGITSYYDDLFLVRSGVISPPQYLRLLAQNLTRVQQGHGRLRQTLAQSSFNAWSKYYKPNENTPNAVVSYYQKGALAALCLDGHIRRHTQGRHSLDTVMRALYQDFLNHGTPLPEGAWQQRAEEITGLDLRDFFQAALYSTADLPLAETLHDWGITLSWQPLPRSHGGDVVNELPAAAADSADFGARFSKTAAGIRLSHVFNDGSAEAAGLCAGDEIIALDYLACTDFATAWQRVRPGDTLTLHYFRHGCLKHTEITAQAAAAQTALLYCHNPEAATAWLTLGD